MADRDHLPWADALTVLRLIHPGSAGEARAPRPPGGARRGRVHDRLTQAELARAAGMSFSAISLYESGRRIPTPEQARRLVVAMGYPALLLDRTLSFVAWARASRDAALTPGGGGFASRLEYLAGEVGLWVEELIRDAISAALRKPDEPTLQLRWPAGAVAPGAASRARNGTESGPAVGKRLIGSAIGMLRVIRGWEREDLARAAGISVGAITRYEHGKSGPALASLRRLLGALAFPLEVFDRCLAFVAAVRETLRFHQAGGGGMKAAAWEIAARKSQGAEALARRELNELASAVRLLVSRRAAPGAWALLKSVPEEARSGLVREVADFQTAGLCELICERSIDAAGDSAEKAAQLADLAMEIAARVPGPEGFRSRLTGYAGIHRANVLRVAGADLPGTDEAFTRALVLWSAGADDDPGLLNEARVLGLEASLRRAQRRLPEAIALLDQALALDRWGETAALLLAKARTLFQLGEFAASIEVLRQAAPQVDGRRKLRQRLTLSDLLALNLCHLGRYAEAELLLPELRALAIELGNRLDLLRVDWLAGRVDAGQGRTDEAIVGLARVREAFRAQGNAYVVALLTVELAEVHASVGRTAPVKALAREAAPLLEEQGVHAEARRALALFCRAAEEERLTGALLRNLVVYLDRARHDPQLRFEAAA